jgi:hypothetical protein
MQKWQMMGREGRDIREWREWRDRQGGNRLLGSPYLRASKGREGGETGEEKTRRKEVEEDDKEIRKAVSAKVRCESVGFEEGPLGRTVEHIASKERERSGKEVSAEALGGDGGGGVLCMCKAKVITTVRMGSTMRKGVGGRRMEDYLHNYP